MVNLESSILRSRSPQSQVFLRESKHLALAIPPHFLPTLCVREVNRHSLRRQYDCRIFAMQRCRACICGHGTGRDFTRPPPLGTCTHR
jgi:hypothetical protein